MDREAGAGGGADDGADPVRHVALSTSQVDIAATPNHVNVSVSGEIDMGDAERLGALLREAAGMRRPLVRIDLSALTFADSSAVRALLLGASAAEQHGARYQLVNPRAGVRRLLDVTGLATALEVVDEPQIEEGPNSL